MLKGCAPSKPAPPTSAARCRLLHQLLAGIDTVAPAPSKVCTTNSRDSANLESCASCWLHTHQCEWLKRVSVTALKLAKVVVRRNLRCLGLNHNAAAVSWHQQLPYLPCAAADSNGGSGCKQREAGHINQGCIHASR